MESSGRFEGRSTIWFGLGIALIAIGSSSVADVADPAESIVEAGLSKRLALRSARRVARPTTIAATRRFRPRDGGWRSARARATSSPTIRMAAPTSSCATDRMA